MAGFFERLFGSNEPVRTRRFDHPRDLRAGDIIKMNFLKQPELSGKTFEVTQINTYIYGNLCYPELILKDREGKIVFLMVEEEDGEEYLAFSKKVAKADIRTLLNQAQLDSILAEGAGTKITLEQTLAGFDEWLAKKYTETDDDVKGMFLKGDARYLSDQEMKQTEGFSSHTLVDKSDKYALEIEVYDTGELELSVTVYHDIDEIDEMWPGENGA